MSLLDILNHLLNFAAPALTLAVALPLAARVLLKKRGPGAVWWVQVVVNFIVGVAALTGSLWWLGRDGKMLAYAALVLAVATSQWLMSGGWRQ
jgi:hypothetical protein